MPAPDAPSRRAVLAAGGAAAFAVLAEGADARKRRRPAPAFAVAQLGWRFCPKCRGLFFSPKNEALGVCPAGGTHTPRKDVSYVLYETQATGNGNLLSPWHRCTKCAGLVFAENNPRYNNACPKGGEHALDTTRLFKVYFGEGIPGMTDDAWDGCHNCRGLYNFAGGSVGVCPYPGTSGHVRIGFVVKLVSLY